MASREVGETVAARRTAVSPKQENPAFLLLRDGDALVVATRSRARIRSGGKQRHDRQGRSNSLESGLEQALHFGFVLGFLFRRNPNSYPTEALLVWDCQTVARYCQKARCATFSEPLRNVLVSRTGLPSPEPWDDGHCRDR